MPFKKGDPQSIEWAKKGARKPFPLEQKEQNEMRRILNKYFDLVKKDKITNKEREKLNRLEKLALKILDKRHANKTDIKVEAERPIMIL